MDNFEPTEDPTTVIVERGTVNEEPYAEYLNTDGKRWRIYGTCNACGACEVFDPDGGSVQSHLITKSVDGEKISYTRTLVWLGNPGTPNACSEEGYESRLDIPMTPDAVADFSPPCVMRGEWL